VAKNKTCAHSYIGHSKAIRDVQFSHDGKHFLSAGFDNKVLYWDTEYGKGIFFIIQLLQLSTLKRFHSQLNFILHNIILTSLFADQAPKKFINLI